MAHPVAGYLAAALFLLTCISCSITVSSDEGSGKLSDRDIAKLSAGRVSAEYVKEIQALGIRSISAKDIAKFWAVQVTPEYIREIKELGVGGISENDIVRYWATGVKPEYIKKMKALGESSDRDIVKY
jgi:hypothetical protein